MYPTSDTKVLEKGTAFETDLGMCGDYNSVIGMDKNNSIMKFLKKRYKTTLPFNCEATISGVIVNADKDWFSKNIKQVMYGGDLNK